MQQYYLLVKSFRARDFYNTHNISSFDVNKGSYFENIIILNGNKKPTNTLTSEFFFEAFYASSKNHSGEIVKRHNLSLDVTIDTINDNLKLIKPLNIGDKIISIRDLDARNYSLSNAINIKAGTEFIINQDRSNKDGSFFLEYQDSKVKFSGLHSIHPCSKIFVNPSDFKVIRLNETTS